MRELTCKFRLMVLILILSPFMVTGQIENCVNFNGYKLIEYKGPTRIGENEYKASFTNMGEQRIKGRIILDDFFKTFTVKWINGDEWVCKYTKIETEEGEETWLGEVTRTKYLGKWLDDGNDAMLIITTTKSSGCITTLNSRKVIDKKYGIDTWKKTFTFATMGKCFEQ